MATLLDHDRAIHPGKAVAMLLVHLIAFTAPLVFTWEGLIAYVALYVLTGQFGVGLGYHRQLCHQSYRTGRPMRYLFASIGVLACQGGPLTWCAIHRLHHQHSDDEGDPQRSNGSFWWSHLFWSIASQMPGLATDEDVFRVTKDLQRESFLRALERYPATVNLLFAAGLFAIGSLSGGLFLGLSLLVWGFFLRVVAGWHATFLANSVAHSHGYRNYETDDNSRNSWWVALLTFGEGWHNNHHAQPRSAAHGHRWWEVDTSYLLIRGLARVGLAWDVVRPRASWESSEFAVLSRRAETR